MLLKVRAREVRVAFHDVYDDRTPRNNISMLSFLIEDHIASDDVCTETRGWGQPKIQVE